METWEFLVIGVMIGAVVVICGIFLLSIFDTNRQERDDRLKHKVKDDIRDEMYSIERSWKKRQDGLEQQVIILAEEVETQRKRISNAVVSVGSGKNPVEDRVEEAAESRGSVLKKGVATQGDLQRVQDAVSVLLQRQKTIRRDLDDTISRQWVIRREVDTLKAKAGWDEGSSGE